jgi:hypothetical protein
MFSHAAVYLPKPGRYVAVQATKTLISWLSSDGDSSQKQLTAAVPSPVQALHLWSAVTDAVIVVTTASEVLAVSGDFRCGLQPSATTPSVVGMQGWTVQWSSVTDSRVLIIQQKQSSDAAAAIVRLVVYNLTPTSSNDSSSIAHIALISVQRLDVNELTGGLFIGNAKLQAATVHSDDDMLSLLWTADSQQSVHSSKAATSAIQHEVWVKVQIPHTHGSLQVESVHDVTDIAFMTDSSSEVNSDSSGADATSVSTDVAAVADAATAETNGKRSSKRRKRTPVGDSDVNTNGTNALTAVAAAAAVAADTRTWCIAAIEPAHLMIVRQKAATTTEAAVTHLSAWDVNYSICVLNTVLDSAVCPMMTNTKQQLSPANSNGVIVPTDGTAAAIIGTTAIAMCALRNSNIASLASLLIHNNINSAAQQPTTSSTKAAAVNTQQTVAAAAVTVSTSILTVLDYCHNDEHPDAATAVDQHIPTASDGAVCVNDWASVVHKQALLTHKGKATANFADDSQSISAIQTAVSTGDVHAVEHALEQHHASIVESDRVMLKTRKRKLSQRDAPANVCTTAVANAFIAAVLQHTELLSDSTSQFWPLITKIVLTGKVSGRQYGAQLIAAATKAQHIDVLEHIVQNVHDLPESSIVSVLKVCFKAASVYELPQLHDDDLAARAQKREQKQQRRAAAIKAHNDTTAATTAENSDGNDATDATATGATEYTIESAEQFLERLKQTKRVKALERCIRIISAVPYNDTFMRSAMSRQLSQSEATLALRVVVRLLRRGKTLEGTCAKSVYMMQSKHVVNQPPATAKLLELASALIDSHFAGMIAAAGNSNDSSNIASVLRGLKELLQTECSTCEILHEVKSQVDSVKKAQQKHHLQTAKMSRSASYRVRTAPADYCLEVFKF